MSILLTDCQQGLTLLDLTTRISYALDCSLPCPYLPCATEELLLCACRKTCNVSLIGRRTHQELSCIPAMAALSAMCPSPCGRYLYQLGSETDSIHTRHLGTGDLLFACKAGVFPRDMKLRRGGRFLWVAGGAAGEALLFTAPELMPCGTIHTKGCCCAVDEWQGGLVLVCAVEDQDIHTVVYTLAPSKIRPAELLRLDGQPGGFSVCPDGCTAILGTLDGLMKICLRTGRILWNLPNISFGSRVECRGGLALTSGDIKGQVLFLPHEQPWLAQPLYTGAEAEACFI